MRNERGIAMVIALVIAVLLSLICLSITFSSMKEFQVATEFENHEKALLVADAGFNTIKQTLRGQDIDALLKRSTNVPFPMTDPSNTVASYAVRNPIPPFQARNIDFSCSTSTGGTAVTGLLTPATGVTVGDCGTVQHPIPCGRYFARITDNSDGDGKMDEDFDGTVLMRIVGVHPTAYGENGTRKNSVAVIEAVLHREMTFDMTAPFSLISKQVNANFDGNSFLVDGYDHSGMTIQDLNGHKDDSLTPFTAISCLYDNPGLGDATAAVNNVRTALDGNKGDNVIGDGGKPSVADETLEVKASPNDDAENIFSPAYLQKIANQVAAVADYSFPTGTDTSTKFSGGDVFGTVANPKVTYVKGNLDIQGNCSGAGIIVVTGDMSGNGGFDFEGLVLVLGTGKVSFGGANKTILGGIVVAKLNPGPPTTFGDATIDIRGRSEFYFAGDKIRLAASLLTMRALSWREITPEIEPTVSTTTP